MDIEKDLIFKMPPKKKYKIKLIINNIKKAVPKFLLEDFKIEDKDIKRQDRFKKESRDDEHKCF